MPTPGDLVKDSDGQIGEALAWDGPMGTVTLASLWDGELWETDTFSPASDLDELRVLLLKVVQR
ncbi:hypothetical protein [Streptomyces alboflavus]|uniref:hypothetical protein n=1 Tax=Streptomyces alboflavus TaxID=67267 RepID=UPI0013315F11|nr:hypothetical protein [Streptomyces alboflavus]